MIPGSSDQDTNGRMMLARLFDKVAQSVEWRPVTTHVGGSIPLLVMGGRYVLVKGQH